MEEIKQKPPYEENDEGFGEWFRGAAKEKWGNYLKGSEGGLTVEERDAMRKFLIEHGTEEEIQAKLDSFGLNMPLVEALRKDVQTKRPNIKLGY